jgi:hypothetical protein
MEELARPLGLKPVLWIQPIYSNTGPARFGCCSATELTTQLDALTHGLD